MKLRMKRSIHREKVKKEKIRKMKKIIIGFLAVLIFVLAIDIAFFQQKIDTEGEEYIVDEVEEEDSSEEEELEKQQKAIETATSEIASISDSIDEILGDKSCYYGIYYCDINTGLEYTLNEDNTFQAASTIKIPIGMMVSDLLYSNKLTTSSTIKYESSDDEDGAGVLQGTLKVGDAVDVETLLTYMIEESDNIATSMLKKKLGSIAEYVTDITGIEMPYNTNIITPMQMGIVLKTLYEGAESNSYYENLIELMLNTSTHDRLDKYIPQDIVAHKIGDYDCYVNDVGIIYTDSPYILCIYTKDVMEEGRENIALISQAIYEIKTNNN